MDRIGTYETKRFSKNRENVTLISGEGAKKLAVHALLELDVTAAKAVIQRLKNTGVDISFTAWVIKCVSQAVSEHPTLNTYRQGKHGIVEFQDVDVPVPIERDNDTAPRILPYIVRKANTKTVQEITKEIRDAQKETIQDSTVVLGKNLTRFERFIVHAPLFIKKIVLFMTRYQGILKKKHMGTVGVTAIGMKGQIPGWVIPKGGPIAVLCVISGIQQKPGVVNNTIAIREFLHMTITVDHALVDGGPLARFINRLTKLIENAYGLENKQV